MPWMFLGRWRDLVGHWARTGRDPADGPVRQSVELLSGRPDDVWGQDAQEMVEFRGGRNRDGSADSHGAT